MLIASSAGAPVRPHLRSAGRARAVVCVCLLVSTSSVDAGQDPTPAPSGTQPPTGFALTTDTRMVAAARIEAAPSMDGDVLGDPAHPYVHRLAELARA